MASYQDYLLANIPILRRTLAQNRPVTLPSGGGVPQSAMTNAQLVSRGPGYGNQAMRVATAPPIVPAQPPQTGYGGTTPGSVPVTPGDAAADAERKKIIAAAVIARLMANPSQGTVAPNVNRERGIAGTNQVPEYAPYVPNVAAEQANITNIASNMTATDPLVSAAQDPAGTLNTVAETAVMTPLKAAIDHVPFFGAAVNELNKPFQWNIGEVGQSVYEKANGQKSSNQAIGGVNLNPTYYMVEPWATDPANKDAINSIYADGLDLDGDGQSDVTGGEAVMMYYFAKEHPGFIDNLVASMGFDPLFAASLVAPMAGALREGAQVGREVAATAGLSKTERILAAADRTLAGVTKAGEVANKVADLPIEGPLWLAGKAIARAPEGVQSFVNWAKASSASTVERRTANEAADFADNIQAAIVPEEVARQMVPDGHTIYEVTPDGTVRVADAVPAVERAAESVSTDVAPSTFQVRDADGTVKSFDSFEKAKEYATTFPTDASQPQIPDTMIIPDRLPTEGMTREARIAAIREGRISQLTPVPGGPRLVDQAWDRGVENPAGREAFIRTYTPLAKDYLDNVSNPIEQQIRAIDNQVSTTFDESGKRVWMPQAERDALYARKNALIQEQIVSGIEHTVDDVAPAFKQAYGDVPDPVPLGRMEATTKSGKASYKDENLPYLYQRYVYTESEKDAARILEVLRKREDFARYQNAPDILDRIQAARDRLNVVRGFSDRSVVMRKINPMQRAEQPRRSEYEGRVDKQLFSDLTGTSYYNGPYQKIWNKGVEATSLEDAIARMERSAEQSFGPRSAVYRPGRRTNRAGKLIEGQGYVYENSTRGKGWKEVDAMIEDAKQLWADAIEVPVTETKPVKQITYTPEATANVEPKITGQQVNPAAATPTLRDELQQQVDRGAMTADIPEQAMRPVRTFQIKKGKSWVDVSRAEAEQWARKKKFVVPEGDFAEAQIRTQTVSQFDILTQIVREMPDATAGEISQAFAERMVDLTGSRGTPRVPMRRSIERARAVVRGVSDSGRSIALYNPVTGVRGITGDVTSDSLRMAMEGHLGAAISSLTPVDYVRRAMGKPSELETVLKSYGRDLPNEIKITRGRTEIEGTGRTPTNKAVSGAIGLKEGSRADRVTGALTGALDNKLIRDARNGSDNVRRESVALSEIQKREGRMLRSFNERGKAWAEKHDILPTSYQAYVDELGQRFTAEQLRKQMIELGRDAQIPSEQIMTFADRLARDWTHATDQMVKAADAEQKRVLFSYERTNLDQALGNVIFFHYWMTRAIPAYARIALRNPEIAAMWVRAWKDIQNRGEREGYPKSLQGFIRFMGTTEGFYGLWNPLNVILPVADMAPDAMAEGWYEQLTQFIFLSPMIRSAFSVLGVDSQATDPLNTYAIRSMVMAIVNKVRAETGKAGPARDPFEALLRRGYEIANAVVAKTNLPGTQQRQFLDPMTFQVSEIRYVVADVIEKQTGIPKDQWGPEQWTLWEQAIADGEAGVENSLYQEAFQQWADAKLEGRVLNSLIPGGVRTRFGPRDALMAGDLTDEESHAKNLLNSGSAADAKLDILNDEYHDIGNSRQRALAKGYNDILRVDNRMRTADQYANDQVLDIGGDTYTIKDVAALDEDSRRELAKAWVASHNGTEELNAYWDERDQWVTEHPEYGAFDAYKDVAYNYTGGVRQFRLDRAAGNPNFKKAMEEKRQYLIDRGTDKSLIDAELDAWTTSLAAYKSAQGIKDYIYDPNPVSTGDQSTVDSVVRSLSSTQQGGAGSYSGKKSTADKLNADIKKYNTDRKVLETVMTGYGIDPVVLDAANPYTQDMLDRQFGDLVPRKTTLQKQYEQWAEIQRKQGADDSVEAFAAYLDSLAEDAAA